MPQDYDLMVGPDGWDKEAVYDAEISPLVAKLIEICTREKLPLVLSVHYRHSDDTGDGEDSCCTTHFPGPKGKFHPKFAKFVSDLRRGPQFLAMTVTSSK